MNLTSSYALYVTQSVWLIPWLQLHASVNIDNNFDRYVNIWLGSHAVLITNNEKL